MGLVAFDARLRTINGTLVATIPIELRRSNPSIREQQEYKFWIEVE